MNPDNKQWQRDAYNDGNVAANLMGPPERYDYADNNARSAYNNAIANGESPQSAYDASQKMWWDALRQAQGEPSALKIGSGKGGSTVVMNDAPPISPPPGSPPPGAPPVTGPTGTQMLPSSPVNPLGSTGVFGVLGGLGK